MARTARAELGWHRSLDFQVTFVDGHGPSAWTLFCSQDSNQCRRLTQVVAYYAAPQCLALIEYDFVKFPFMRAYFFMMSSVHKHLCVSLQIYQVLPDVIYYHLLRKVISCAWGVIELGGFVILCVVEKLGPLLLFKNLPSFHNLLFFLIQLKQLSPSLRDQASYWKSQSQKIQFIILNLRHFQRFKTSGPSKNRLTMYI